MVLYSALALADIDILADAKGVVDQKEDPGKDVAHQGLSAKADSDTDHPGTGQ